MGSWVTLQGGSLLLFQMWKASAGHAVSITQDDGGADDWETDPDFVVGVTPALPSWAFATEVPSLVLH